MFSQNLWINQGISLRNDKVRVVKEVFYKEGKKGIYTHLLLIVVKVDFLNYKRHTLERCVPITNNVKLQHDRKHRMISVATEIKLGNHNTNISMINYSKQSNIFRSD